MFKIISRRVLASHATSKSKVSTRLGRANKNCGYTRHRGVQKDCGTDKSNSILRAQHGCQLPCSLFHRTIARDGDGYVPYHASEFPEKLDRWLQRKKRYDFLN